MDRERIGPIFRPHRDGGRFLLFDGNLNVEADEGQQPAAGQIELRLLPKSELLAHIFGPAAIRHFFNEGEPEISVPNDAPLLPPIDAAFAKQDQGNRSIVALDEIQAGDLASASQIAFHVSGALNASLTPVAISGGARQPQIDFQFPGWDLVLAIDNPDLDGSGFSAFGRATPTSLPISVDGVERLGRWLFILLSFVANRELGIGPTCGLNAEGQVVWLDCGPPRLKLGKGVINWCTPRLVSAALPQLAAGFEAFETDEAMEVIVDRAIGYALAANGDEVIDVRIPIACSGLELLAWAVLQRHRWLIDGDARRKLGAAAAVRLLLKWAGIPTAIPQSLPALEAWRKKSSQPDWEGPEVLFNVRNGMVHPPKRLSDPEWPDGEELFEAWQLGTWYLELVLLRILGYEGEYWSRVRLGRSAFDLEPVPWLATTS